MKIFFTCSMPLAAVLCILLLFSCTSDIELPPPPSSSSVQSSSSGSVVVSSSSAQSSSSPYTLACSVIKTPIDAGKDYSAAELATIIKIDCKDRGTSKEINGRDDVSWTNGPGWANTKAGTYSEIKIKIYDDIEACKNMDATCTGTLTVNGGTTPSSSSRASSSSVASSSSATSSASTAGPCSDGSKGAAYCKWGSECSAIDSRYGYMGEEGHETCKGPSNPCACADLIQNCKDYSPSKTVYYNDACTSSGGGSSSASGGGSSSASGGGSGTITLTTSTSNSTHNAGTYTLTANGVNTCSVNCGGDNTFCSLSGAITQSGQNYLGNLSVSSGSLTITGSVKFNNCWKE